MIAASPTMTKIQLFLFDPEDVPRVRVRAPVDKELRRRRREARERYLASLNLLPAVAIFFETDGQVCHVPGVAGANTSGGAGDPSDRELSRIERLERRTAQRALRKSKDEKRRAKAIFALWDQHPDWLNQDAVRRMDAEISRATEEVQRLWSPNERRKRSRGLNATEKDPLEHWTPAVANVSALGIELEE